MRLRENKGKHILGVAGFMHDHAPALGLDHMRCIYLD